MSEALRTHFQCDQCVAIENELRERFPKARIYSDGRKYFANFPGKFGGDLTASISVDNDLLHAVSKFTDAMWETYGHQR